MSYKESYKFDKETGTASVKIEDNNGNIFLGTAQCHPDDMDIMSESIGLDIAGIRAKLNMMRNIRDTEIKPQLKILTHICANITTSKHFNPDSYEIKSIWRQINLFQKDLENIKTAIKTYNNYIKELGSSGDFVKQLRNKEIGQN